MRPVWRGEHMGDAGLVWQVALRGLSWFTKRSSCSAPAKKRSSTAGMAQGVWRGEDGCSHVMRSREERSNPFVSSQGLALRDAHHGFIEIRQTDRLWAVASQARNGKVQMHASPLRVASFAPGLHFHLLSDATSEARTW